MTKRKLKSFGIRFIGPYSPQLFKAVFVDHDWKTQYDQYTIGTGESKAVAALRAVSHLKDVEDLRGDIDAHVQYQLNENATVIEGDGMCSVYCIIGIEVDDD